MTPVKRTIRDLHCSRRPLRAELDFAGNSVPRQRVSLYIQSQTPAFCMDMRSAPFAVHSGSLPLENQRGLWQSWRLTQAGPAQGARLSRVGQGGIPVVRRVWCRNYD
jgi:hypothetical protein